MNDLNELLTGAVAEDARATSGDALADALRPGIRRRVRTRRGVRAAGVGSLAAVSAGAMAFGVARLPGAGEMQPAGGASADECPPGAVAVAGRDMPVTEGPGDAAMIDVPADEPGIDAPHNDDAAEHGLEEIARETRIVDGEEVVVITFAPAATTAPAASGPDPVTVCVTPKPSAEPSGS